MAQKQIAQIVIAVTVLISMILFIVGATHKQVDPEKQKATRKKLYISGGVLLGLSAVMGGGYFYYFQYNGYQSLRETPSRLAFSNMIVDMAEGKRKDYSDEKFMNVCNNLVNSSDDPILISQFADMKEKRPVYETQNFCKNMAKSIIYNASLSE